MKQKFKRYFFVDFSQMGFQNPTLKYTFYLVKVGF